MCKAIEFSLHDELLGSEVAHSKLENKDMILEQILLCFNNP